jgi:hypothetical protein
MTDVSSIGPVNTQGSAPAEAVSTPAAPTAPQKFKVDWEDGNAEELSPEDLISNYKMTRRQADQLRKQMDPAFQFLSALQGGELDSLYNLNIPEDKMLDFAERVLTKKLEFEQMSPQQKALLQKEREIAERERQYKEWEAKQEAARQQEINHQALNQVQTDIVEAIKELGLSGKPTPRLIRRVAEQLKAQIEASKPMDARRASKHEWDNIQQELQEFQMAMLAKDPHKFVESLPKEIRKAIRDYEVKAGSPFQKPSLVEDDGRSSGGPVRDFDYLDKIYGSKPKRRIK